MVVTATASATPLATQVGAPSSTPQIGTFATETIPRVGPSPTATATTPTPVPMTPSGSVLRFGETWFGDQLNLTTKGRPYDSGYSSYLVQVDFSIENTSDSKLNFDMLTNSFYLEFNDGRRFPSRDGKMAFNDFGHGNRRDFSITWNLS